jgi:protein O-GlcNAc transferase
MGGPSESLADARALVDAARANAADGDLTAAERDLRRALVKAPQAKLGALFGGLGLSFLRAGRGDDADRAFLTALELEPENVDALSNRGSLLLARRDLGGAISHWRQARTVAPGDAVIAENLRIALVQAGQLELAEGVAREIVAMRPQSGRAYRGLAMVLALRERMDEAEEAYALAAELGDTVSIVEQALQIPAIPQSIAAIERDRQRIANAFEAMAHADTVVSDPASLNFGARFYLAYHGRDDRSLLTAAARGFGRVAPALRYTAAHVADWAPPRDRRIKFGVVSDYLGDHSVGRFFNGALQRLDTDRFEMIVAHGPRSKADAVRGALDGAASAVVALPEALQDQREIIAGLGLDALLMPDLGMSGALYWLGHARLAPVQITGLGHPSTTGLPELDWFVSAAATEPAEGDDHYSERLARLPRLPSFFQTPRTRLRAYRDAFGLPSGRLYGCLQSAFKIHPAFDPILEDIVRRDRAATIVLPDPRNPAHREALRRRWAAFAPALVERVHFVPRVSLEAYSAIAALCDVHLDPIHFGGGVTMYDTLHTGVPIVTWPGRLARGRYVLGAYKQMGCQAPPVASTLADYAGLAVDWAADVDRRRAYAENLDLSEIYEDGLAVEAFSEFLTRAVVTP